MGQVNLMSHIHGKNHIDIWIHRTCPSHEFTGQIMYCGRDDIDGTDCGGTDRMGNTMREKLYKSYERDKLPAGYMRQKCIDSLTQGRRHEVGRSDGTGPMGQVILSEGNS